MIRFMPSMLTTHPLLVFWLVPLPSCTYSAGPGAVHGGKDNGAEGGMGWPERLSGLQPHRRHAAANGSSVYVGG